jgi:hypothetical protein
MVELLRWNFVKFGELGAEVMRIYGVRRNPLYEPQEYEVSSL